MFNRAMIVYSDEEHRNVVGRLPACPANFKSVPWNSRVFGWVPDLGRRARGETVDMLEHYLYFVDITTHYSTDDQWEKRMAGETPKFVNDPITEQDLLNRAAYIRAHEDLKTRLTNSNFDFMYAANFK
jgi:hypothetical protein